MPFSSIEKQKEYYQSNKKRIKQYNKDWQERNKEHFLQLQKDWQVRNKEHYLQLQKDWRNNNKAKLKDYRNNHKEQAKKYQRDWNTQNPDKLRQYRIKLKLTRNQIEAEWCKNNQDKIKKDYETNKLKKEQTRRDWRKNNRLKIKKWASKWSRDNKKIAIFHYTKGKMCCEYCGKKGLEFLTFDHIYNDGKSHRKTFKGPIQNWLVKNNFPKGLQVLCFNCNCVKAFFGMKILQKLLKEERIINHFKKTNNSVKWNGFEGENNN